MVFARVETITGTVWRALLFFLSWAIVISIIFSISSSPQILHSSPAAVRLYSELVPFLAVTGITFLMVRYIKPKDYSVQIAADIKNTVTLGSIAGLVWISSSLILYFGLKATRIVSTGAIDEPVIWVLALFLNTAMQELLIRGYLFSMINKRHGVVVAGVVTTMLFIALHGPDLGPYGFGLINLILASIVFTQLLVYTQGVLAPTIAHYIWNLVGGMIFSIVVLADDYPSYNHSVLSGVSLLSGGNAKLEGSIVVTIMTLIVIVGLHLYNSKLLIRKLKF